MKAITTVLSLVVLLGFSVSANSALIDGDYGPSVTTDQTFLSDFITLSDKLSFEYYWEMGIEPTKFNFDKLLFNGAEWEKFGWKEFNHGGSSTDWESAWVNVPGWARGQSVQLMFSLDDGGQKTDPTVYLRNLTSISVPLKPAPEPATMLLFATGLAGLAGFSIRRKKK